MKPATFSAEGIARKVGTFIAAALILAYLQRHSAAMRALLSTGPAP